MLTADELLAGSRLTFDITVPAALLAPGGDGPPQTDPQRVRLRPLTVEDLQLVSRAARENDQLLGALMVQRSLVAPEISVPEAVGMHVGLMQFLLDQVNRISGITPTAGELDAAAASPLARAAFILAREFGWTPQEVNALTLGQVLLHLEMLKERRSA
jgi:hypothetical protein